MYDLLCLLKKQNVTSQTIENLKHLSYVLSFKNLIFFVFSFFFFVSSNTVLFVFPEMISKHSFNR